MKKVFLMIAASLAAFALGVVTQFMFKDSSSWTFYLGYTIIVLGTLTFYAAAILLLVIGFSKDKPKPLVSKSTKKQKLVVAKAKPMPTAKVVKQAKA